MFFSQLFRYHYKRYTTRDLARFPKVLLIELDNIEIEYYQFWLGNVYCLGMILVLKRCDLTIFSSNCKAFLGTILHRMPVLSRKTEAHTFFYVKFFLICLKILWHCCVAECLLWIRTDARGVVLSVIWYWQVIFPLFWRVMVRGWLGNTS